MNFKVDENIPIELIEDLRRLGHGAQTVPDQGLMGAGDPTLLGKIKDEAITFLTMDKGIADIRRYPPHEFAGLILLRPQLTGRGAVLRFARRYLSDVLSHELRGRLVIVTDGGIRIR